MIPKMVHGVVCPRCHKSNNNLFEGWAICMCGHDLREEMTAQPYRQLAVMEKSNKPTCGLLHPSKEKPHKCNKPGWLDRLFRVDHETLWRCGTCGKVFEFIAASSPHASNIWVGEWQLVNQSDWIDAGGEK